ncbi:MAG: DUF354 domain-containing protein [Bacteroidota bacterium]
MRILIDIGHPGHVHLLKNTIQQLKKNGHIIYVFVKDIPVAKKLLTVYGIEFIDLGKKRTSILGKLFYQLKYNWILARFVRKNNITLGIGSSITLAHISKITKMKSIILDDDDDEMQPFFVKFGHPFADVILSPDSIKRKNKRTIYYAGTHELAYLHPANFITEFGIIKNLGFKENDTYFVLRFVALQGHHDIGHAGISLEQKRILIQMLKPYGKVFITSEKEIESEFEEYRLPVSPENILTLMSYSTLFLGDSQTMTSEAAILGVPALKLNTFAGKLSIPNELEKKYQLCYAFHPENFEGFIHKLNELLSNLPSLKVEWQERRAKLFNDKINVTSFFVWFIENYPNSSKIMNENPNHQYNFK